MNCSRFLTQTIDPYATYARGREGARHPHDPDWAGLESVISIEFHTRDQETEIRFTQTGFPNAESGGRHEHGWSGCFDKLDAALAAA